MSTFYGIEVDAEGRHRVYATDDGISRIPVPRAAFGNPRDAIRYAEMRQTQVSPLRSADDGDSHQSRTSSSAEPSGASVLAGRPLARSGPK